MIHSFLQQVIIFLPADYTVRDFALNTDIVIPKGKHKFTRLPHPNFTDTMLLIWNEGQEIGHYAGFSEAHAANLADHRHLRFCKSEAA